MALSFVIVDDDAVSRRMLEGIIEQCGLGEVAGTADGGIQGEQTVLSLKPDIVLIDLLMPDQDGIETISQLRNQGFAGQFVMISQVVNKDMVGSAYHSGVEFFIHKPINRVEVEAVLSKVRDRLAYERHIQEIKRSLAKIDLFESTPAPKERHPRDVVKPILMELGIMGESGSKDIMTIMELLSRQPDPTAFPALKELYEAAARTNNKGDQEIDKESKAIEQRLRRTVMAALSHMASIGLTDYSNPKFEHYAPLYFDFQDVRLKMKAIEEELPADKGKVNVKKFLQVMHAEMLEKLKI
ncbi:two-component system response regulator YcbB [Paenibacillus phyllosphaerae]|uniref:Two-component system response regulator YcbB n=1 Tax=Paenibacillus phyllosphaerae TaxID=274593 RepID=A0A7W5AWF1_9BACL|nr:response regulator [Paenibacillus phyllosphaerae]MBB3110040.1 two-component system response regulator YcbB [Paenibacillus phyllosphaerae]